MKRITLALLIFTAASFCDNSKPSEYIQGLSNDYRSVFYTDETNSKIYREFNDRLDDVINHKPKYDALYGKIKERKVMQRKAFDMTFDNTVNKKYTIEYARMILHRNYIELRQENKSKTANTRQARVCFFVKAYESFVSEVTDMDFNHDTDKSLSNNDVYPARSVGEYNLKIILADSYILSYEKSTRFAFQAAYNTDAKLLILKKYRLHMHDKKKLTAGGAEKLLEKVLTRPYGYSRLGIPITEYLKKDGPKQDKEELFFNKKDREAVMLAGLLKLTENRSSFHVNDGYGKLRGATTAEKEKLKLCAKIFSYSANKTLAEIVKDEALVLKMESKRKVEYNKLAKLIGLPTNSAKFEAALIQLKNEFFDIVTLSDNKSYDKYVPKVTFN